MKKRLVFLTLLLFCLVFLLSSCTPYTGRYDDGIKAFSNGDFAKAAAVFDLCDPNVGNAKTYADYSHGMVFWEKGQFLEALPFFEKTQGFMYGTKRFHYCKAFQALSTQAYQEACSLFLSLEDFEDSAQMAEYCKALWAEQNMDYETALFSYENAGDVMDANERLLNLQTQIYNKAIEFKDNGEYDKAIILFNYLGDYLNSAKYALECRNVDTDQKYEQAERLVNEGKLEEAYRLYRSLGVYGDSAQKASELASMLGIPEYDESRPYEYLE